MSYGSQPPVSQEQQYTNMTVFLVLAGAILVPLSIGALLSGAGK